MSAQVDHDLLADYVGGALDGTPDAGRVAHLIATSADWRRAADDLSSALGAVSDDLQALRGTPEIMPSDLVAHFDDLLASPAFAAPGARPAQDPLAQRVPTRKQTVMRRMKQWAAPITVAAAAIAFFSLGGLPTAMREDTSPGMAPPNAMTADSAEFDSAQVLSSSRQYSRGSLPGLQQRNATTDGLGVESWKGSGAPLMLNTVPGLERLNDASALRMCLAAVMAARPGKITYIEFAYFEGAPALVMSITTPAGPWSYVAGADCGINGPAEIYSAPLK